ncbi:MAG: hypothetical protein AB7P03_05400 [Kofleriaceae bacterium]
MKSRFLIPRLLSGKNQLTRREKVEIFEHVVRRTSGRRAWLTGPRLLLAACAAGAVALVLVFALGSSNAPRPAQFASRGASAHVAAFELVCGGVKGAACRTGDRVAFDLQRSAGYRYFAAFAKASDGTVIWYFPETASRHSVDLSAHLVGGVLDRTILLEGPRAAGRLSFYGIFSGVPLTQQQIIKRFNPGATDVGPGTAVVVQELTAQ